MPPLVDSTINLALDDIGTRLDEASLHTAFPAGTGANEVTGGTYARVAISWNAAASRNLDSTATVTFNVPGSTTVIWSGYFDTTPSPDAFQGYLPLKQASDWGPRSYQVDITANTILLELAGPANDDRVVFYNGAPPTGITEGDVNFVVGVTAGTPDTFQVSLTQGGAAIVLTAEGADDTVVSQVRPETFAADGQYQLTDVDWAILGVV